jgi:hypothetical protein
MYLDTIKGSLASFDGAGGGAGLLRSGWSATSNPPPYRPLVVPHGPLPLLPSSTVLNYGQGLFEGLKAFRRADNTIVIFRPDKNAARCRKGCARLLMPPVPDATFVEAVSAVAAANARFVPPTGAGALYLRPLVFGSGGKLGVAASSEFTFVVWCSPVGNYFRTNGTDAGGGGGACWARCRRSRCSRPRSKRGEGRADRGEGGASASEKHRRKLPAKTWRRKLATGSEALQRERELSSGWKLAADLRRASGARATYPSFCT